jgi:hypothetical protein
MSLVLNGIPKPHFALYVDAVLVDEFSLSCFAHGPDAPPYLDFVPDTIVHELDPDTTPTTQRVKHRGYRATIELRFPRIDGTELAKLTTLLTPTGYDQCLVYPFETDTPNYWIKMDIADMNLDFHWHGAQMYVNFTLKLESVHHVDNVPLEDAAFLTWGNDILQFGPDLSVTQYSGYT